MICFKRNFVVFFIFFCQNGARAGDSGLLSNKNIYNNDFDQRIDFNKDSASQVGDDIKWKNLEEEVFQELSQLSFRKQREIFEDLKKQQQEINISNNNLASLERQSPSPLNGEELKYIQKALKSSNNTLPTIRNKRTLNLLLFVVAKAMRFSLIPPRFNVQWSPRTNQLPPTPSSPPSSSTPSCKSDPPCPNPSFCSQSTTVSPCLRSPASTQPPTIPPNQIDANTINYPFRPAKTIPLFNFAPLPVGVTVPYPPLLQPPMTTSPCARAQTPSTPPCGSTFQPPTPSPCPAMPSTPPCGMTAPSSSQGCRATAIPRQPCATPSIPKSSQPCGAPSSQTPCATSSPSPSSSSPPCAFPTSQSSPPVLSSTEKAPKNSIFLQYDNPVRIHIFSNEKKYLPASGSIYRGQEDDYKENSHSYFFPNNEENRDKNKSEEKKEEEDEEEIVDKSISFQDDEEEKESEAAEKEDGQKRKLEYPERKYAQWDSYGISQKEEENDSDDDESEFNLSLVRNPIGEQVQRRRRVSLKQSKPLTKNISLRTKHYGGEDTLMREKTFEETARVQGIKKPKNSKLVRVVKKQIKKNKTDSHPEENFRMYTSKISPKSSFVSHKVFSGSATEEGSQFGLHKDFTKSVGQKVGDVTLTDLEKNSFKKEGSESLKSLTRVRRYKENEPKYYESEVEDKKRKELEKAVERYVEDYIEKQIGQEVIKNTGIPKTTVFEFVPKNGPRIQTITTTVAKTNHQSPQLYLKSQIPPEKLSGSRNFHLTEETGKSSRKYNF